MKTPSNASQVYSIKGTVVKAENEDVI